MTLFKLPKRIQLVQNMLQRTKAYFSVSHNASKVWEKVGDQFIRHSFWMFACPVHLMLGRDSFVLVEPAPIMLMPDEVESLALNLNQHFNSVGLHFYIRSNVFFLGLDMDPKITTSSIEAVKNKDIRPFLPHGEGASAWMALQNEIQMLLFNHPINVKRELQKQLPVNSLWCYGLSKH